MLKYKDYRYAAETDETEQRLEPQGAGKKFQLSDGQVDVLSQILMLGVAILLKQGGVEDKEQAKAFDFSALLRQFPQLLAKVATDRNTMQKEINNIIRYGPDKYIARYTRLLRAV